MAIQLLEPGNRRFRYTLAELMALVVAVAVMSRWPLWISLLGPLVLCYVARRFSVQGHASLPRWWYRISLPAIWLTAAYVSWRHPGDEYGLFLGSTLPGVWILAVVSFSHLRDVLPLLLAAGTLSVALVGWALDRLRVRLLLLLPIFLAAAIGLTLFNLYSYPSYQRAMSKNGSLTAYISSAICVSLYLATAASLILTLFVRSARSMLRRFKRSDEFVILSQR